MSVEIITKDDLQVFGMNLLEEIRKMLGKNKQDVKDWLKGKEVKKLLNVAPGTLLTWRATGKLRYSKIGGIYYYSHQDIQKMLDEGSNSHE
ncbi:helix-turn-helix domain-containing protein [Mucilaginibacter lappiensis]|uniref:Putative site-specific integrase-resolvase n=1 Tax=Mucilaginibacter lappiensis TaxID=354630 RepID=A0A841JCX6_9SPHI|nr:helix-turn-helix domain-containing protein [Mucilaginibacter lappiensis]MBB6127446.1 putative site-specific integrase-resolvase [Mucilaginibacter lappiensis]